MPNAGPGQAYWRPVAYGVTTEAEARNAVRELAAKKVDMVKLWLDDHLGEQKKMPYDVAKAIIDEAHNLEEVATDQFAAVTVLVEHARQRGTQGQPIADTDPEAVVHRELVLDRHRHLGATRVGDCHQAVRVGGPGPNIPLQVPGGRSRLEVEIASGIGGRMKAA